MTTPTIIAMFLYLVASSWVIKMFGSTVPAVTAVTELLLTVKPPIVSPFANDD